MRVIETLYQVHKLHIVIWLHQPEFISWYGCQGRIYLKIQPTTICQIELRQILGQDKVKEWSEHRIKAIFELSTLGNPYIDSLVRLIDELHFFDFYIFHFYIFSA